MKTTLEGSWGHPLEASRSRERDEERETPDELWTLAVTSALVQRLSAAPAPPEPDAPSAPIERAPENLAAAAPERGEGAASAGPEEAPGGGPPVPSELCAEVSDERLGRLELRVARAKDGLDIVISVADAHVKALIMAEQGQLMKTLKEAGLTITSLQIGSPPRAGTALALDRSGAERPRGSASFRQPAARWRAYQGPPPEDEDDRERVDFTA